MPHAVEYFLLFASALGGNWVTVLLLLSGSLDRLWPGLPEGGADHQGEAADIDQQKGAQCPMALA